ncbi:MAG: dephospho-CoA kinase [Marinoscillum sp.]
MPKNKPFRVGITGGIGAGKSIVARVFSTLDIPVYDADSRAKWLMNHEPTLKSQIIDLIGARAYQNGTLNRKHISSIAFKDQDLLDKLNALVHPAVAKDFDKWSKDQLSPYVLKEAALLFEANSYKSLDRIITVTAPEELRIARVIKRDGRAEQEVKDIISKQWPESRKTAQSDFVIENNEEKMIIPQVLEVHQKLLDQISG